MRRAVSVTVWLMVGVLAAPDRTMGQAALTPADSAILNSQPLKRLVLAPSLLRRISLLAAGLDREVVLCLQGTVVADTALVGEFTMPDIVRSSVDAVIPLPCAPATTLAVWHNHPWVGPDSSFGVRTPADLCSLSQPDLRTVVADSIPFAVVSVGRTAQPIECAEHHARVQPARKRETVAMRAGDRAIHRLGKGPLDAPVVGLLVDVRLAKQLGDRAIGLETH